jgi:hypothetical protein
MAGVEGFLLEGGNAQPTLTQVGMGVGRGISAAGPPAHLSVIALVVLAVVVLYLLDKFGFRFAVTAGRR